MSETYTQHWTVNNEEFTLSIEKVDNGNFYWSLFSNKRTQISLGLALTFSQALSSGTTVAGDWTQGDKK